MTETKTQPRRGRRAQILDCLATGPQPLDAVRAAFEAAGMKARGAYSIRIYRRGSGVGVRLNRLSDELADTLSILADRGFIEADWIDGAPVLRATGKPLPTEATQ